MTEAVESMARLLLSRLVAGEEPIRMRSRHMNMTLLRDIPDRLLASSLILGDAQLTLPSEWCDVAPPSVDCTLRREPISVKVLLFSAVSLLVAAYADHRQDTARLRFLGGTP